MDDNSRQDRPVRRARVEDADYVLSSEEPNLPRVREQAAAGGIPVPALIAVCAALMVICAALFFGGRSVPADRTARITIVSGTGRAEGYYTEFGLDVEEISAPVAAYYRSKGKPAVRGVGVFAVDPEGPAAALCPGDVITAVDGKEIASAEELARAWEASGGTPVLTLYRDGGYVQAQAGPAR